MSFTIIDDQTGFPDVYRSAGSTAPIRFQIKYNGGPYNLTGKTLTFYLMDAAYWYGENHQVPFSTPSAGSSVLKVDGGTMAADADTTNYPIASGYICWTPSSTNVNTAGDYVYQIKITNADTTVDLIPAEVGLSRFRLGPSLPALHTS